jgi:hypothetical protein
MGASRACLKVAGFLSALPSIVWPLLLRFRSRIPSSGLMAIVLNVTRFRSFNRGEILMSNPELNGHLVAIFCHGIWHDGKHHGLRNPDEGPKIDCHGIEAVHIANREKAQALIPSGGRTRPDLYASGITISEAQGMKEFLQRCTKGLDSNIQLITEDWARDSFENLLFSMFAYCHATGHYPARFTAVSWRFKANRILLIGNALGITNFDFVGVENPGSATLEDAIGGETSYLASLLHYQSGTLVDPLHRAPAFEKKRKARMLPEYKGDSRRYLQDVSEAYTHAHGIDGIIAQIADLRPGDGWRRVHWPWCA